jgi:Zn-dependent protease/CBS domain-containing protein
MDGLRIATIRGIPIRVHVTFLLALPLVAWGFARAFVAAATIADIPPGRLGGAPWAWGLLVAIVLFLSVLVHELAHSLYAQRRGGRVRGITLLLIGGVSQVAELPKRPRHEAVMALVGPLASLGIGVALLGITALIRGSGASFGIRFGLFYAAVLNLFLGLFNLLPAFPMDGGRILRALLVPRRGLVGATRVAATVGKVFAILFAVWGVMSLNLILLLIAFFVFVGAEGEARAVLVDAVLGRVLVGDLMSARVQPIAAEATVAELADRMVRERRLAYPVVTADGRPLGVATLEALKGVAPERRGELVVAQIAQPAPTVSPRDDVARALRLMSEADAPQLAVVDEGQLVGLIGRDEIGRALALSELQLSRPLAPRPA